MNTGEADGGASPWALLAFLVVLVAIMTIVLLAIIDTSLLLTPFEALVDMVRDDPSRAIMGE